MKTHIVGLTLLSLLATSTLARADDVAVTRTAGVGIGAEQMTTGLTGATVVYDALSWRIAGLLGMQVNGTTDFDAGVRVFFRVHQRGAADFSLGFGGAVARVGTPKRTDVHIEGAAQLRAFLLPNFAIGASVGFGLIVVGRGGDSRVDIAGQLIGGGGIWYFF